jgi:hypothetical protein
MFRHVCASVAVLLAFAWGACAQDDEPLFSRLSDRTLQKIFDDGKIAWERKETTDKTDKKTVLHWLTFPGGLKATVMNHGNHLTILSLGFKTKKNEEVPLERMNEWNLRFGSHAGGYVNTAGFAIVCSAHHMEAGTNQKLIGNWLKVYSVSLSEFSRFTE